MSTNPPSSSAQTPNRRRSIRYRISSITIGSHLKLNNLAYLFSSLDPRNKLLKIFSHEFSNTSRAEKPSCSPMLAAPFIKSVVASATLPSYTMNSFLLPKTVYKSWESCSKTFGGVSTQKSKNLTLKSWKSICQPTTPGGLWPVSHVGQ